MTNPRDCKCVCTRKASGHVSLVQTEPACEDATCERTEHVGLGLRLWCEFRQQKGLQLIEALRTLRVTE